MVVLTKNRLSSDFFAGCATCNARKTMQQLFPEEKIKGRKRQEVLSSIDLNDKEVTPAQFRDAMWTLVNGSITGAYHRMELANSELFSKENVAGLLQSVCNNVVSVYGKYDQIETGYPLDARMITIDSEKVLEILFLGEAEAETHDYVEDREELIDGKKYKFKAYLVSVVPVISKIKIGCCSIGPTIKMCPIHQGTTPKAQLTSIQEWLEDELQCPLPTIAGIKDGIRQLMISNRIKPIVLNVLGEDGCKVTYKRALGIQNPSSKEAEDIFKQWETNSGSLQLDNQCKFRVDTARSVFTFTSGTDSRTADNVIHTVLGAAS